MGSIPPLQIGFLVFSLLVITFTALVLGDDLAESTPVESPDCGLLGIDCVGDLFGFILDLVTFNIPDAPWWIRVPMGLLMTIPWFYTMISVIAGFIP